MSTNPTGETVQAYSNLAQYYDVAYDAALGQRVSEVKLVRQLMEAHCPDAQSVLELGTGTGSLLKGFKNVTDDLTGIDISPEMLAIARQKVPEADFHEADIAEFELDRNFDVAICLFDTLNHLRSFDRVEAMFERTDQHLKDGGIFIFDIVTPNLIRRLIDRGIPAMWVTEDGSFTQRLRELPGGQYAADFTIKVYGGDDEVKTVSGSVLETTYPVEDVKAAASEHFEHLVDFDMRPLIPGQEPRPATDNSRRPVFVYGKR